MTTPDQGSGTGDLDTGTNAEAPGEPEHPLDALVPDPTVMAPLADEPHFAAILSEMVAGSAPRIFAVVQEYGERVEAHIAAWGMAFEDRAELVSVDRGVRMSLREPEQALCGFHIGSHIRARLVWCRSEGADPSAAEAQG